MSGLEREVLGRLVMSNLSQAQKKLSEILDGSIAKELRAMEADQDIEDAKRLIKLVLGQEEEDG